MRSLRDRGGNLRPPAAGVRRISGHLVDSLVDSLKLAPSSRWVARLAVVFLVSLFAVNVYRALTQAVVCDEAFSYRLFLSRKPRLLFTTFDANYHVLHTWLTYASVKALGISAITLRIPSLAACILYFTAVYRISRRWFGTTPLLSISCRSREDMGWRWLSSAGLCPRRCVHRLRKRECFCALESCWR